jgi:hypothetical protein
MTDKLTASERELVTRARELTRVDSPPDLRHYLRQYGHELNSYGPPHDTTADEYVFTTGFYDAQHLLGQLADLTERLCSGETPE